MDYPDAVGALARSVLLVGFGLVAVLVLQLQLLTERPEPWRSALDPSEARHAYGSLEGRVAWDEALAALIARPDVPELIVRVTDGAREVCATVDDNGRFVVDGLSLGRVDLDVSLGGESLASLTGLEAGRAFLSDGDATPPALDPRLDGVALAGPLHVVQLTVEALGGAPVAQGLLAWRHSGEAVYERVAPVVEGAATVVSLTPLIDVWPLLPGYVSAPRPCVFDGDRLVATPGARLSATLPSAPEGVVLRLEADACAVPAELSGVAAERASEGRGAWPVDGVAELWLVQPGPIAVRWAAFATVGERVTRLRGFESTPVAVDVRAEGVATVAPPFEPAALAAAIARFERHEGRRPR